MIEFLAGMTMAAAAAVAIVFAVYYRDLRDRLFALFAASFCALAVSRVLFMAIGEEDDARPLVYLVRLVGYLLLLAGVIDKNRPMRTRSRDASKVPVHPGDSKHPPDRDGGAQQP